MLSPQSRAVNVTFVEIRMSVHLLIFFVCESNGLNIFCFLSYFCPQFVICIPVDAVTHTHFSVLCLF